MKLFFKLSLVALCLIAGYMSLGWGKAPETSYVKVGDFAPRFQLEKSGQVIDSTSIEGKVVLVNFFATWCGPCLKELPHLEKEVWAKYKNHPDFQLLVIGREHSEEDLQRFLNEKTFSMPFYPDPERKVYSKFALQTIPRNYIIGKDGRVVYAAEGFSAEEFAKMQAVLSEALK